MTEVRSESFGQSGDLSVVDRFGIWLSRRSVLRHVGSLRGKALLDVGCGFDARFGRTVLEEVGVLTLCDVALASDLTAESSISGLGVQVRGHVGPFEATAQLIGDESQDVVLCLSVLEHLVDDIGALVHLRRVVRPGGVVFVNVPSWMGKRALELSAFKLGMSPASEMNDHKRYYDPRDLWPLLVAAGFRPQDITCRRHKFGLNTFAVCRVPKTSEQGLQHEL